MRGSNAPPPLNYTIGVNHIYRHHSIAVIFHLRPLRPSFIELLEDIVEDVRERLATDAAEKRLLLLVEQLGTRTPRHSTLNAIRARLSSCYNNTGDSG